MRMGQLTEKCGPALPTVDIAARSAADSVALQRGRKTPRPAGHSLWSPHGASGSRDPAAAAGPLRFRTCEILWQAYGTWRTASAGS